MHVLFEDPAGPTVLAIAATMQVIGSACCYGKLFTLRFDGCKERSPCCGWLPTITFVATVAILTALFYALVPGEIGHRGTAIALDPAAAASSRCAIQASRKTKGASARHAGCSRGFSHFRHGGDGFEGAAPDGTSRLPKCERLVCNARHENADADRHLWRWCLRPAFTACSGIRSVVGRRWRAICFRNFG